MISTLIPLVIGCMSALLSSMSGAGAALFATPLFLAAGMSLPTVLACNQLCAALWTPIASRNYKVGEPLDRRLVIGVALMGLVGVGLGYKVAMMLSPEQFKQIIGALILVIVGMSWFRPARPGKQSSAKCSRALAIVLGLPLGAYQAFFGGGNTLLSSLMYRP